MGHREHKIGEVFEYNGKHYKVVEHYSCGSCDLQNGDCDDLKCTGVERLDGRSVCFKEVSGEVNE